MKKLRLIQVIGCIHVFACGAFVGWCSRGNGTTRLKEEISQTRPTKSTRPQERTREKSAHDAKWVTFGKRADDLGFKEKETLLKELAPGDRVSALEALASTAGLNGLNYRVKSMMEDILERWADEDFDTAWNAAQREKDPELSGFMVKALLNQLVKKDEDRAFALHVDQLAADPDFTSGVPGKVLASKLKIGAEEYLAVLGKTKFGSGSSGTSVEFAENFDFRLAADGVAELMKDRKSPANFPTNFYTEWAKKDPDAVFDWWATHNSPPFNDLDKIIKAVDGQTPGGSAVWLAGKYQDSVSARPKIVEELSSGSPEEMVARVRNVAANLPDVATADSFLTEIVTLNNHSSATERYASIIASLSSPEVRLAAFQTMKEKHRMLDVGKISDEQLQQWQLNRSQLERIFTK